MDTEAQIESEIELGKDLATSVLNGAELGSAYAELAGRRGALTPKEEGLQSLFGSDGESTALQLSEVLGVLQELHSSWVSGLTGAGEQAEGSGGVSQGLSHRLVDHWGALQAAKELWCDVRAGVNGAGYGSRPGLEAALESVILTLQEVCGKLCGSARFHPSKAGSAATLLAWCSESLERNTFQGLSGAIGRARANL